MLTGIWPWAVCSLELCEAKVKGLPSSGAVILVILPFCPMPIMMMGFSLSRSPRSLALSWLLLTWQAIFAMSALESKHHVMICSSSAVLGVRL